MKNFRKVGLLLTIVMALAVCLFSCYQPPQPMYQQQPYQMMTSPTGQQMVMFNDNGSQVLLDYMIFQSLMNSGGYGNVLHSYRTYPQAYHPYNPQVYAGWNRSAYSPPPKTTGNSTSGFRSNTPSTGREFKTLTPSSAFRSSSGSSSSVFRSSNSSPSSGFRSSSSSSSFRSSGYSSSSSSGFRSSSGRH